MFLHRPTDWHHYSSPKNEAESTYPSEYRNPLKHKSIAPHAGGNTA